MGDLSLVHLRESHRRPAIPLAGEAHRYFHLSPFVPRNVQVPVPAQRVPRKIQLASKDVHQIGQYAFL